MLMKRLLLMVILFCLTLSQAQDENYLVIKGSFVIIGKSPDGDSVRFRPDQADLLKKLKRGYKIQPSKDGTVQLRFEAIDAPELHYIGEQQPLGAEARDLLLHLLGFNDFTPDKNDKITFAQPQEIRGGILSQAAEVNGRPVSYAFLEAELNAFNDGERIAIGDALLGASLNANVLQAGMAYYTVYSSQPQSHQIFMRGLAQQAKEAGLGIWQVDRTAEFTLVNLDDVTQQQLILPKLFRRCVAYLRDRDKGFSGTLHQWLLANPNEDDAISIGSRRTTLSSVIEVNGNQVRVLFDPLKAVFLEK
jgi:endonuclease YncB( thermonuclease family)